MIFDRFCIFLCISFHWQLISSDNIMILTTVKILFKNPLLIPTSKTGTELKHLSHSSALLIWISVKSDLNCPRQVERKTNTAVPSYFVTISAYLQSLIWDSMDRFRALKLWSSSKLNHTVKLQFHVCSVSTFLVM